MAEASRKRLALSSVVVLIAVFISWHRRTVHLTTRTPQSYLIHSGKTSRGFIFKVIKRSNSTDVHPTSTLEAWVLPGRGGAYKDLPGSPPLHIHLRDDELFEVVEGTMGYYADGVEGILKPGETALLPAGKPHTFWNAEPDKILHQKMMNINKSGKHSPNERFFEQWGSNAYDHGGVDNVNPLQLMLMLKYGHIELAAPYPVRLLIWYVLCPLAEILGYKGSYPEYIYA